MTAPHPPSLPPGLDADGPVDLQGVVQRLDIRDARGVKPALRRLMFVFPELDTHPWAEELKRRLARFANESELPHIRRPLEIGKTDDGALYVLVDRPQRTLSERLGTNGLLSDDGQNPANARGRAMQLLEDVAAGLASLHSRDLFHGGLHDKSVSIDHNGRAWIDDAPWGPLWHWSEHKELPDGLQQYLPKDAGGRPLKPSKSGDVYALGVLSLRLLLGPKAPQAREQRRDALLTAGLRLGTAELILRMLEDPQQGENRFQDALQVQAEFHRLGRPFSQLMDNLARPLKSGALAKAILGLALLALSMCLVLLASCSSQLTRAELEREAVRAELETCQGEHKELGNQVHLHVVNLNKLQEQQKEFARERLGMQRQIAGNDEMIKALQRDDAKKQLREERDKTKRLKDALDKKEQALDQAEAMSRWQALANSPELSFEAMQDSVKKVRSNAQREIIKNWMDEFEQAPQFEGQRDKWWIELKERNAAASVSSKLRMRWRVWVKVGTGPWQALTENHDWDPPPHQEYPEGTSVAVPWSPGQPIRVQLVEIGRTYNTTRIDRVFDGPVAIWQLHNTQWLYWQDGEDWVGIKLSAWKCPGPSQR